MNEYRGHDCLPEVVDHSRNRFFDTFDCTRQTMKDEEVHRGSHIRRALGFFFVLVSNHYFTIVLFL